MKLTRRDSCSVGHPLDVNRPTHAAAVEWKLIDAARRRSRPERLRALRSAFSDTARATSTRRLVPARPARTSAGRPAPAPSALAPDSEGAPPASTETASRVNASAISATTSACDSLRTAPPAVARTPSVRTAFGGVPRGLPERRQAASNALATSARPNAKCEHFPVDDDRIGHGTSEPATTITRTSDDAQRRSRRGPDHRDGGRFGEIPQREMSAPGAERHSDRGFATPGHGPRQQQRRDVRAGDEQQHAGRGKQQQERGAELAERVLPQVEQRRRVAWMRRRIEARDVAQRRARHQTAPAPATHRAFAGRTRSRCSPFCSVPVRMDRGRPRRRTARAPWSSRKSENGSPAASRR